MDAAGHEPYRLASAYTHKWDGPGAETRRNNGRDLVSALVPGGTWEGTFFIFDRVHREAPPDAVVAAKAELARSILTALSMWPRWFVEKPAGFSSGVWQVRMTLPRAVSIAWGGSPFVFTIPELEKSPLPHRRQIRPSPGVGLALHVRGRGVDRYLSIQRSGGASKSDPHAGGEGGAARPWLARSAASAKKATPTAPAYPLLRLATVPCFQSPRSKMRTIAHIQHHEPFAYSRGRL